MPASHFDPATDGAPPAPPRRIWDISQKLRPGVPVWPGESPFEAKPNLVIGPDCPVATSTLSFTSHLATHADAPSHYDAEGLPIGEVPLETYLGPAQLLDVTAAGPLVRTEHVLPRLKHGVTRLLLRTYAVVPQDRWDPDWAAICPTLIEAIAACGVRLIGTDTPSLDPMTDPTIRAHHQVRRHGLAILEGLVLDGIPEGRYELIALPLRMVEADSSPVRAVLRSLE